MVETAPFRARGPLINWIRLRYSRVQYRVRSNNEFSEMFNSLWGILAGDSASPTLSNIFVSDFDTPKTPTDISLQDHDVDHMLLAHDIVELTQVEKKSPDLSNLQRKMDYTYNEWCRNNFLELNVSKTKAMLVGAKPSPERPLTVFGEKSTIEFVDQFPYGGITFSSNPRNLFNHHYDGMIARAKSAAHAVFATESFVGSWSVPDGVRLYYARVDPYLYGSEVVVDVSKKQLERMEAVQVSFFRRLKRRGRKTPKGPLWSETGVDNRVPRHFDSGTSYPRLPPRL